MSKPKYSTGDRVTLKADKNQHPWAVINERPNGTIVIVKEGKEPTPFTSMYVTESKLQSAVAQR